MPIGPGKYDDLADYCIMRTQAKAVVVVVFEGNRGSGMSGKEAIESVFEIAGQPDYLKTLPDVLRKIADTIEESGL